MLGSAGACPSAAWTGARVARRYPLADGQWFRRGRIGGSVPRNRSAAPDRVDPAHVWRSCRPYGEGGALRLRVQRCGGGSVMTSTILSPSKATRDAALATGMARPPGLSPPSARPTRQRDERDVSGRDPDRGSPAATAADQQIGRRAHGPEVGVEVDHVGRHQPQDDSINDPTRSRCHVSCVPPLKGRTRFYSNAT
jgi:hypothetical protein